jgi:glutamine synthetase
MGFITRHRLWTEEQREAAEKLLRRVEEGEVDTVRLAFVDQHGLLRGKTVAAEALASVFQDGMNAVSTLLSKDTSGRTVFSAFAPDGGVGVAEMAGAGDLVMVPDPATFHHVSWAERTGRMLCDLRFHNGRPVPFCSRGLLRRALERAQAQGVRYRTGLEVEFHLFQRRERPYGFADLGRPGRPTEVEPLNDGYQLLSEARGDDVEPVMTLLRTHLAAIGIPLRTTEVEFGPSQVEVTLSPGEALWSADTMVLLRSTVKQIARRNGYHATFMCRPRMPHACASGWHLHQSLLDGASSQERNLMVPDDPAEVLSPLGRHFVGGQLTHARAACVFAAPTINGYKRFQSYSMAPDRVLWARENRAAMIRVVGAHHDGSTHIENRVGEPAANPYLYMGSQLLAGLEGIDAQADPGVSADEPYLTDAPRLPATLSEALDALQSDTVLGGALGEEFVDYFTALKRAEISRFESEVSEWEQREYFDLF